jgi:hypothetical protein
MRKAALIALVAIFSFGLARAADLHPIVEIETGYLFGGSASGKWIKAEQAAKAMADETTYRIYGLTQSFGEAKGSKPIPFVFVNQRDKLFQERRERADEIARWQLFDSAIASSGRRKSADTAYGRRILSKGLYKGARIQRAKCLQSRRSFGFGWRRQNGGRRRIKILRRRSDDDSSLESEQGERCAFGRMWSVRRSRAVSDGTLQPVRSRNRSRTSGAASARLTRYCSVCNV